MLWLFLITVLVISIRSVNVVNATGQVAKDALTKQQEQTMVGVRELARAFAVEWATWNGNQENYRHRIGVFFSRTPNITQPREAVQQVTSSTVVSLEETGKDIYRVKVLLHTHRLTPVKQAESYHPALIPVTQEDLERLRINADSKQEPLAWVSNLLTVEVAIKTVDGKPTVAGMPVIVSNAHEKGTLLPQSGCNKSAPPDLVTLVNQFLNLYYSGQSLSNYVAPGSNIQPVGDWNLERVINVRCDNDKSPTKAQVEVLVSTPGIGQLTQQLYLKLVPVDGTYLIEDIGSGF